MAHAAHTEWLLEVADGVAVVTMADIDGTYEWGTQKKEHRWNPHTVAAFNAALDAVEANRAVGCLVVTGQGKFWSK